MLKDACNENRYTDNSHLQHFVEPHSGSPHDSQDCKRELRLQKLLYSDREKSGDLSRRLVSGIAVRFLELTLVYI